ncbi:MAG: methyl-accepting chemotaxis protein [Dehalococcoidia bacterium]|nr:methyl-accepting chemotaxis protein [Dehalococcoidia bacterium]
MKWFRNIGLRWKLLGVNALLLAMLLGIATLAILQLQAGAARTADLYELHLLGVRDIYEAKADIIASGRAENRAHLADNPSTLEKEANAARAYLDSAEEHVSQFAQTLVLDSARAKTQDLSATLAELAQGRDVSLGLLESGDREGAASALRHVAELTDTVDQLTEELVDIKLGLGMEAKEESAAASDTARTLILAASVIALVTGFGSALLIARMVQAGVAAVVGRLNSLEANDIADLGVGMRAFADGDLTFSVAAVTEPIPDPSRDEVGQAATAVNGIIARTAATVAAYDQARSSLTELVGGVQAKAKTLDAASDQLTEASTQMAAATGQIATAISEVTTTAVSLTGIVQQSAVEVERVASGSEQFAAAAQENAAGASNSREEASQMGQRIAQVATSAKQMAAVADESRDAAQQGQEAVSRAVSSMESIAATVELASGTVNRLGEYGQQIGEIVNTIDEIAAQTNLLALNAAIEAARAGEQGRGFAVVAENVRSLAERSSEATKEIAELISKVQAGTGEAVDAMTVGVQNVEEGRTITSQAGEALQSILVSVQHSSQEMERIATDVEELQTSVERIVDSANAIAASAQQSATGATEMAASTARVSDAVMQVSATSEQTSASAEEVSASAQELSAQSEELAATAGEMRSMAESLTDLVSRFKVEVSR